MWYWSTYWINVKSRSPESFILKWVIPALTVTPGTYTHRGCFDSIVAWLQRSHPLPSWLPLAHTSYHVRRQNVGNNKHASCLYRTPELPCSWKGHWALFQWIRKAHGNRFKKWVSFFYLSNVAKTGTWLTSFTLTRRRLNVCIKRDFTLSIRCLCSRSWWFCPSFYVLLDMVSWSWTTTEMRTTRCTSWAAGSCAGSGWWWSTPGARGGTGTATRGAVSAVFFTNDIASPHFPLRGVEVHVWTAHKHVTFCSHS